MSSDKQLMEHTMYQCFKPTTSDLFRVLMESTEKTVTSTLNDEEPVEEKQEINLIWWTHSEEIIPLASHGMLSLFAPDTSFWGLSGDSTIFQCLHHPSTPGRYLPASFPNLLRDDVQDCRRVDLSNVSDISREKVSNK